jgi:hypothetical protein
MERGVEETWEGVKWEWFMRRYCTGTASDLKPVTMSDLIHSCNDVTTLLQCIYKYFYFLLKDSLSLGIAFGGPRDHHGRHRGFLIAITPDLR